MVLLTMTPGIVRALGRAEEILPDEYILLQRPDEPSLTDATPGNPVSHSQLIDLSKLLKKHVDPETPSTLSSLLTNTQIYIPPPPPPPAKSPEYLALMARLRRDQESLTYTRMLQTSTSTNYSPDLLNDDDDLTYSDIHRQLILIINILISIVCVAVFIWVAARHWSVGLRLGLSMGGSLGVAVAEVGVYAGYVRKVAEAKRVERKKPEVKEIVRSWVVGRGDGQEEVVGRKAGEEGGDGVRKRKGKHR